MSSTRQTLANLIVCDWDDALAEQAQRNGQTYTYPLPVVETILGMKHVDGRAVGPNRGNCEHCSPRAIVAKRNRDRVNSDPDGNASVDGHAYGEYLGGQ